MTTPNRFRFRFWDSAAKQMLFAELGAINLSFCVSPNTLEYMQSTGLVDRNGLEIFEGDLLQDDTHHRPIIEMRWWSEAARFQCFWGNDPWEVFFHKDHPHQLIYQEVLGNKYEHGHLLNEERRE